VNFAYEKLVEGETYVNELSGKPKKSESVMGVLRSFKALKEHFGQLHVNFGSPIYLDKLIESEYPQWRREDSADDKERVSKLVSKLGSKIMSGINEATHVNAMSLLAMALLNSPDQSMSEASLRQQLDIYLALLEAAPYSKDVTRIQLTAEEIIAYGEQFGTVKRNVAEGETSFYVDGSDAVLMTYFRNNIVHLFVLPSFVACCFLSHQSLKPKQVVHWFRLVYPFLKDELSMHWSNRQITYTAKKVIASFIDQGLIKQSSDSLSVAEGHQQTMTYLSRGVLLSLERFYLTVLLLKQNGEGFFTRFELEKAAAEMAEKLSRLNGLNSPEFFDKVLFKGFIEMLYSEGIIWANDKGKLTFGKVLNAIIDDAGLVMSQQVRKNVHGLVKLS